MTAERSICVIIDGHGRQVAIQSGQTLAQALQLAGVRLNMRCAGRGLCEGCTAVVNGRRIRGCEHIPTSAEETFYIPARSLLAYQPQIVSDFVLKVSRARDPLVAPPGLGAVIDIGTTTVAALVVDLETSHIVHRAAAFNRQMEMGDDVVTRINLCLQDASAVGRLQEAVIEKTITPLLENLAGDLKAIVVAGNTTMLHLLAGVNPGAMGTAPYTPAFLEHRILQDRRLACCPIHLLPSAAAYVGADLVAGALATGLLYDQGPSLLVDVGTNGEIILAHNGKFLGCATAAGPAFEGAGLSSGVRAGDGAVAHIRIANGDVHIDVIGKREPIGLCGSAYIDFLAEARRAQWINSTGRFELNDERVSTLAGCGKILTLSGAGSSAIVVSESDIARLLAAKAAIAAGIVILLRRCGLAPADVAKVYLAGGFGSHMNAASAIASGLLPDFRVDQVEPVGNSALAGAYLALLDKSALDEMKKLATRIDVLDLNHDPGFEDAYIDHLVLPDVE